MSGPFAALFGDVRRAAISLSLSRIKVIDTVIALHVATANVEAA
jgi:hypothetical protein